MTEHKLIRIEGEFDPERCQAVHPGQQCPFKRVEGSKYCARHGGANGKSTNEIVEGNRNYMLTKWRARVNALADSPVRKSMNEELGILRMMLEEILNQCENHIDLQIYSSKIVELVREIRTTVIACDKLDRTNSLMLDRSQALVLGSKLIGIIGEHVNDPDQLDILTRRIAEAFTELPQADNGPSDS